MNKHFSPLAILCLASLSIIVSCKKSTETPPPADTKLEITVSDKLGNKVSNATVALFGTQNDWEHATNQIGLNQKTNVNGVATFSNLSSKIYYWGVIKDCENNVNGSNTTTQPITVHATNRVSVAISSTGAIKLMNTSANPYKIYFNGVLTVSSLAGNSIQTFPFMPTGNYSIRVVQLSGLKNGSG